MSLGFTLDDLYRDFRDQVGFDFNDKPQFIRRLNTLLVQMGLTKPAERLAYIYFSSEYRKYPLPSDFRSPLGLRAQSKSTRRGLLRRYSPGRVSQMAQGEAYAIQNRAPTQFIDMVHTWHNSQNSVLTECDSLTADGVWTAGSGASSLAINTVDHAKGGGALGWTVTAATSTISFVATTAIDISGYGSHAHNGFLLKLPEVPTQITIRFGTDSSNYYTKTLTTQASGEAFSTTEFNEIRLDKNDATVTGTPTDSSAKYFLLTLSFSGTPSITTGYLIDRIVLFKPEIMELEYYTKHVAQTTAGVLQATITESESSTDLPLVFDDYRQTIVDGLSMMHFRNIKPELSEVFRRDYIATIAPSGALMSGMRYLNLRYPNREQHEQHEIILPSL